MIKVLIKNLAKNYPVIKKIYIYLKFKSLVIPKLKKQLLFKKIDSQKKKLLNKKVLLPIIETTSHYEIHHLLGLAKALEIRGAEILVLVCDEFLPGCEIKSVKNEHHTDPCWFCRFNLKNVINIYNFEIITLKDLLNKKEIEEFRKIAEEFYNKNNEVISHGIKLKSTIRDSIVRYFYGAVPKDKLITKKVFLDHTVTSLISLNAVQKILNQWEPELVINNMISYSAWEPIYKFFVDRNIEFHSLTNTPYDFNKIDLNFYDIYKSNRRFKNFLSFRQNKPLNKKELLSLQNFLKNRFLGNAELFKNNNYFDDKNDRKSIINLLKIDQSKRNLFLFSNLYWDVGMSERSSLYEDVITWVCRTIEILGGNKDINLYVKTHPAEKYDSSGSLSGVQEIVLEKIKNLPSNVTFIEPEYKIKPYDLFPFIDLGLLYDGTLGLEMLNADVPIVDVGNTPYAGLGFAGEPINEVEYKNFLLGQKKIPKPNKESINNFSYFYFISSHIPWTLTEKYYGNNFSGFNFSSLDEITIGKNPYLDHLCDCILNSLESKPDNFSLSS